MGSHKKEEADAPAAPVLSIEELKAKYTKKREELPVDKLFRALVRLKGSDLHLKVGRPPIVRVNGELKPLNRPPIDAEEMAGLLFPLMDERNRVIFDRTGGADFAYVVDVDGVDWRFRVNLLTQLGRIGLVARRVNNFIPNFEGLNLPPVMETLCHFDQGMVLLAGVTGSGKSTTIASMLNYINSIYSKHILTLEDPIELVYT
jgi:twitching motility protein PilT